jgi:hypothetical protein
MPNNTKKQHHKNIVLDPITHLTKVGLIVDDISHEIIHRAKHSPNKDLQAEANNVTVMEGFGRCVYVGVHIIVMLVTSGPCVMAVCCSIV